MRRTAMVKEQLKMSVRSALRRYDLELIRHPYLNRLATTLDWLGIGTVIDVGANIGQFASALRSVGYRGRIVSCEPLSDAFAHLERRAATDSQWTVVRTAVGAAPAQTEINVSANSYSSSIRTMTGTHLRAAPDSRVSSREQISVTTVAELMADLRLVAATALLKVDTQGYESEVLDGAAAVMGDFAAVQLELSFVPLYESQQLIEPLTRRMSDAGFELFSLEPGMSDPQTGRLLQCDGLFVNAKRLSESRDAAG